MELKTITQERFDIEVGNHSTWLIHPSNSGRLILRNYDLRYIRFPKCDLSGAIFSGSNLSGVDLSKSYLQRIDFSGADLSRSNFSKSGFGWEGCNFCGSDLKDANLLGEPLSTSYYPGSWF